MASTEDMWETGNGILNEIKDYIMDNKIPVIAGEFLNICS